MAELFSLITDIGLEKITTAAGSNANVAISHVAIGDGNGARYNASHAQTVLRRERSRVAIQSRENLEATSWLIRAEFPPVGDIFEVREFGFFDVTGSLIAVWAESDKPVGQTGVTTFLLEHVLNFSAVRDGVVIIDAPEVANGATEAFVDQVTRGMAQNALANFRLWEAHHAAHGHYPA